MKRFVLFFILLSTPVFSSQSEGLPAEVVYKMLHNCSVGGRYSLFRTIQKALDADRCETISIAPGTYYENLSIHRSVTLTGASGEASEVIIDGGGADRIINVTTGSFSITLKNLTLQNGVASSGPAFYAGAWSEDLTLENVTVQNNTSIGTNGAIFINIKTSLIVDGVTCTGNMATSAVGGCLSVAGGDIASISNSTFSDNSSRRGGALDFYSVKTVTISDSIFENNTSSGDGGAIHYVYVESDDPEGSLFALDGVSCDSNTAENGGCIYASANKDAFNSSINVTNTIFTNNEVSEFGGGFYSSGLDVSISSETIFDGNTSVYSGGGVFLGKNERDIIFLKVSDTEFTNNEAYYGGGLYAYGFDTIQFSENVFNNNKADVYGGAVYLSNVFNALMLDTSTFSENSAANGGGIYVGPSNFSIFFNLLFYKNEATSFDGGAFYSKLNSMAFIYASTFSENSANRYGGAIYLNSEESNEVSLTNLTIYKNTAGDDEGKGGHGGGLYVAETDTVKIERTVIASNKDSTLRGNCEHSGKIVSEGYNRDTDTSCNFTEDTDDTINSAGLEDLADNGGPTLTHMLSPDSVLIDAGGSGCTGTDQRGASWPVDGDASSTAECDIGAVEYGSTP